MWRSVLLHEFPDEDIHSLQALPGSLTVGPVALHPQGGAVQITPGRGFRYDLRHPLRDVIGVSCRIRLRYPFQGVAGGPVVRLGNAVRLLALTFPAPNNALFVRVRVGETELDLGGPGIRLAVPFPQYVELRFDWHTSGQAYLRADGRLVRYHNALSPAARFTVADITLGLPDADATQSRPRYEIGRLFIRALARQDSLAMLSRELPAIDIPDDDLFERCRLRTAANLLAKLDRVRNFMTHVNQTLSQPWPSEDQPAEGPFAPDAILAHDLATRAVAELWKMLRSGDYTTPDNFLTPFTQFLEIMHRALPAEFEQLAAELADAPAVPDECQAVFEEALAQGRQDLAPLLALLAAANERVTQIAGGN
jgi:hypothetical protein